MGGLPDFVDKNALEYASFHLFNGAQAALKLSDNTWWVNHMSGYEHNLRRFYNEEVINERLTEMVRSSIHHHCFVARNASVTSSRYAAATLVAIPYFGGKPSHVASFNTGSAHSRLERGLKLRMLHAVLCSALHVANRVLVGVCNEEDYNNVQQLIKKMVPFFQHSPSSRVTVHILACVDAPAYLPYRLLVPIQQAFRRRGTGLQLAQDAILTDLDRDLDNTDFLFVIYNEADQTLRWESGTAVVNSFGVLETCPRCYVAPQRFEKRWGAPAEAIERRYFSKGMNKCGNDDLMAKLQSLSTASVDS